MQNILIDISKILLLFLLLVISALSYDFNKNQNVSCYTPTSFSTMLEKTSRQDADETSSIISEGIASYSSEPFSQLTSNSYLSKISFIEATQQGCAELTEQELIALRPFIYLLDENAPKEDCDIEKIAINFIRYNTYPFHMPYDYFLNNTLFFSDQEGKRPNNAKDLDILSLIQEKIPQLIFENFPPLEAFEEFSIGGSHIRKYGLHFFGGGIISNASVIGASTFITPDLTEEQLRYPLKLVTSWNIKGSQAICQHLDFAIRLPSSRRMLFFNEILPSILSQTPHLETLSLRFMQITDYEISSVINSLTISCRKIQRLILSFNNISDSSLSKDGVLTSIIGNTKSFPHLKVLDIIGNPTTQPEIWSLDAHLSKRISTRQRSGGDYLFRHGFNGLSHEEKDQKASSELVTLRPYEQFLHPVGFDSNDLIIIKNTFTYVCTDPLEFKSSWLVSAQSETVCAEHHSVRMWANMANQMLVLRHGAHSLWHTFTLTNKLIESHEVEKDIYNGYLTWFLKHIKNKFQVTHMQLTGVFSSSLSIQDQCKNHLEDYGGADHNIDLSEQLEYFPSLLSLNLSTNHIKDSAPTYGISIKDLTQLQRFDFDNNELGGHNSQYSPTSKFFANLSASCLNARYLSHINLSHNFLTDKELEMSVLPCLERCKFLSFCDLSYNHFTFDSTTCNSLLRYLEKIHTSSEGQHISTLYELNLSHNRVRPELLNNLTESYKELMKKHHHAFTILILGEAEFQNQPTPSFANSNKGNLKELSYGRLFEKDHNSVGLISNIKGFYRAADFLVNIQKNLCNFHTFRPEELPIVAIKALVYSQKAESLLQEICLANAFDELSKKPHNNSFSPRLLEATGDDQLFRDQAEAILLLHGLTINGPLGERMVEERAKAECYLYEYHCTTSKAARSLQDNEEYHLFKMIPQIEQTHRILNALLETEQEIIKTIVLPSQIQHMSFTLSQEKQALFEFSTSQLTTSKILDRAVKTFTGTYIPFEQRKNISISTHNHDQYAEK